MCTAKPVLGAYDLVAPQSILFGPGRSHELGDVAARLGTEAWLVTSRAGLAACGGRDAVAEILAVTGLRATWLAASAGEPTVADVAAVLERLPTGGSRRPVIVAVGGGSTIDLAKAVAAMATNMGPEETDATQAILDRLEGVGRGLAIRVPPLPVVAVPTTAGTGAEATRNAVVSCPDRRFKKSMRSPLMVPRAAIVDPGLTVSCPRQVTAASGIDAITQLIESFVCRFTAAVPRALALDALPRAMMALPRALADGGDLEARAAMSHAALLSGLALTNSGLGMAHGVAAALGIECGTPHGVACAVMLPVAVRVNRPVCQDDFATLERAVDPHASSDSATAADAFVHRVDQLCATAGTPRRLAELGLSADRIPWLAAHSGGASMRGNPVEMTPDALAPVLEAAF